MSEPEKLKRPLSPHLTIYRPQYTSVLSILHRLTGLGLLVTLILVVFWFVALGIGPDFFVSYKKFLLSKPLQVIMFFSTWALWYHTCNGVRHLLWDFGYGFKVEWIEPSSLIVLTISTFLSLLTVYFGWFI